MSKLKPIQMNVALSLSKGIPIVYVAENCGVSRVTIHNWLRNNPDFVNYLNEMQAENIKQAQARLQAIAHDAVEVLGDLMVDAESDLIKFNAAKEILTLVGFYRDAPPLTNICIGSINTGDVMQSKLNGEKILNHIGATDNIAE